MGNCMETCSPTQEEPEAGEVAGAKEEDAGVFDEANGVGKENGLKVKIILTKGELEWLLLQLKEHGEKRLQDVLEEIERGRGRGKSRADGWKPSLESIMEIPEAQSF